MQDLFYNLPKERFSNLTLEIMLNKIDGINDTDLLQTIKKVDSKLDKIANDVTITPAKKMLLSKEVYLEDGMIITDKLLNVISEYKKALEDNNAKFEVNKLRAEPLSQDQKALLPLVKEQYTKNNKISENDNYNKTLIFLADNGLIDNQVLKSIDTKTPAETRQLSAKLSNIIDFVDNTGATYVDIIESYKNNVNIKNIEQTVFVA